MKRQGLDASFRVRVGLPQVYLLDVGEILDRGGVPPEKPDIPAAALEKTVGNGCVVLQDEQAPIEDETAEGREIFPVEKVGARLDEGRHAVQAFE